MKKILLLLAITTLLTSVKAEDDIMKEGYYGVKFHPGVGLKLGIFYPSDVNTYMENYFSSKNISVDEGT